MKQFDVIAMGELLIDFTMNGVSEQGNQFFEACPGGAPCNVLAMLTKLGKKTSFLGKVGQDQFGTQLKNILQETGIDASQLCFDATVPTTLAFVHTFADGDRAFSFYRSPGADMMLCEEEVDAAYLKQAKVFHFGTLSMTSPGVRAATKKAVQIAQENGLLITFDPNLREALWASLDEAKEQMEYGFAQCDVLKIADNELQFVTGQSSYDAGIAYLQERYQIPLIFLTLGKEGSRAYHRDTKVSVAGFPPKKVVDTTGAGDTFFGCALGYLLEHGIDAPRAQTLSAQMLEGCLQFANAGASIVTTKKGAIRAMPTREEILQRMQG